jgi:LAO/AO transport system kinase
LENRGLDALWAKILEHKKVMTASGARDAKRRNQQIRWMWALVEDRLLARLKSSPTTRAMIPALERDITPVIAMERLLAAFLPEDNA